MERFWEAVHDPALEYGRRALGAAVILAVGWLAIRLLVGPLRGLLGRSHIDPTVGSFVAGFARGAKASASSRVYWWQRTQLSVRST